MIMEAGCSSPELSASHLGAMPKQVSFGSWIEWLCVGRWEIFWLGSTVRMFFSIFSNKCFNFMII